MRKAIGCLLALVCLVLAGDVEGRTWTSADGRTLEAEFVRVEKDVVYLKLAAGGGKVVKVGMAKLSEDDRDYVHERVRKEEEGLLKDPGKYFNVVNGSNRLSIPKLEGKRLSYSTGKTWVSLNIGSSSSRSLANIPHSGMMAMSKSGDLAELAEKERNLHGPDHDKVEMFDVRGGGRMLVYSNYEEGGKVLSGRRCFLWLEEGDGVVVLDFTDWSFSSSSGRESGRKVITRTLAGLRVNARAIPVLDAFANVLFGGDPGEHSKVLSLIEDGEGPGLITLREGEDEATVMKSAGMNCEYLIREGEFVMSLFVEDKEPGSSPHRTLILKVSLLPGTDPGAPAKEEGEKLEKASIPFLERTLSSGERMIFYARLDHRGRKQAARRCFMWKRLGSSVLKLDGSESVFTRNPNKERNEKTIRGTLKGLRANGRPIAAVEAFLDYLLTGESSSFADDPLVR